MKRIMFRLALGAGLLIAVVAIIAMLTLWRSLPDLDGEIVLEGLAAAAAIERDADGIPVITASNREDLAFATGFAHAQDRFFQMDMI
ncbi:MAG: penicillin acylase family protein, partial [Woeseiaceae bacterium]